MDWSSIAGVVGKFAPTLGELLGSAFGPVGGIVGGIAGRAIAGALGVEATPEAISAALAKDKNAVEKLRILEATKAQQIVEDARVEVERVKAEIAKGESIGMTQRAEIAAGVSWWHWRHLIGYLVLGYGLNQIVLLNLAAFRPALLSPDQAVALFNATGVFTGGLFALLGYVAGDTTNRINTAVTGEHSAGGIMNTLRAAFKKKP